MNHARTTQINTSGPLPDLIRTPALAQTTCPYCGVGCGVDITLQSKKGTVEAVSLKGTPEHPANFGRLCVKGTNLLETTGPDGRLLYPAIDGKRESWDTATTRIADKIASVVREHGPEAVAFYVSGQLLTEDYYVANKLVKGFLGTANIDTNSRLCMSSAVAAHKRAFGEDIVPCQYDDLECADCIIFIGSNAAWTHPVLFQRIERAKQLNPALEIVLIDPRGTDTATLADCHLKIKPGTDAVLFNGLLRYIVKANALDSVFIDEHTTGFEEAIKASELYTAEVVAEQCDIALHVVLQFFEHFTANEKVISFFSMGINQSSSGVDKGNAIINCHLATGKIGKSGSGPFSITGQPNAMGGREVGGLANMLAAHMDIDNPVHRERVQRFWQSPTVCQQPGLKAVDMFKQMAQGKIKFVWVMATNPVVSMPNRNEVEQALAKCDMVVVSDIVSKNDTLAFADVVLPASGWSEKDGTVTNSERRISRQRGLMQPPGEARHDWQALCDVAKKLGFADQFSYSHPADIFAEHAALTAFENNGERALDLSGLCDLSRRAYDSLTPVQWPVNSEDTNSPSRIFGDGRFYTADKRAHFVPVSPRLPQQQTSAEFPFILNTGRLRDQWHTMTRTGRAPTLLAHTSHAALHMFPDDMAALDVAEGDLASVNSGCSSQRSVILPIKADIQLRRGSCFAPIHWSATWGSHLTIGALFDGSHDPISGQPELKQGAVAVKPVVFPFYGKTIVRESHLVKSVCDAFEYWAMLPLNGGTSAMLATSDAPSDLLNKIWQLIPGKWVLTYTVSERGLSLIATENNNLMLGVWTDPQQTDLPDSWLEDCLGRDGLTQEDVAALLRRQPEDSFLQGPVVCSCFSVRRKVIDDAITAGASSVEALGEQLKCGTNCGSCKPELKRCLSEMATSSQEELIKKGVSLHD